jgi:hypothetical protein
MPITKSADPNCGDCAEPFNDAKITFLHDEPIKTVVPELARHQVPQPLHNPHHHSALD